MDRSEPILEVNKIEKDDLYRLVEKHWELEHIGIKDKLGSPGMSKNYRRPKDEWSPQEIAVDNAMKVVKHKDFYSCSIPWKSSPPDLSNNLSDVLKRQKNTNSSKYLTGKGTSITEIDEKFRDQLAKGYIEEITDPADINRPDCFYIPYFPVVDKTRESTKVRIVFDAAAKSRNGKSLNSQIEKGPNRLQDLFSILLRFRMNNIAITADISEMFLQCRLSDEDKRYHRFWWDGRYWQWTRVLFGNLASPDISQKILVENADFYINEFPLAADVVKNKMYMDDAITSVETKEEGIRTVKELPELISHCGMKICKFQCSDIDVIKTIPKDLLSAKVNLDREIGSIFDPSKVLGIIWDANCDCFLFKAKYSSIDEFLEKQEITEFKGWTKSLILRFAATVFDPLGLIAPFTVRSRKILQKLWQEDLAWKDLIPEHHQLKWCQWLKELFVNSSKIKIPRSFHFGKGKSYTLHVFVDASTEAYAAAVYVRVVDSKGVEKLINVESYLVTAKARVTPTKAESVSRLELNSAVIGHRLGYAVALAFSMDPEKIYFWTDSMNVLYWINTPANQLKTFVSNRVGQIQSHSNKNQWRHVPTDQNPADIATRDISISELSDSLLWWKGPDFLRKNEADWPAEFVAPEPNEEAKGEIKKLFSDEIHTVFHVSNGANNLDKLDPERFSVGKIFDGYDKLLKIIMLCISWFHQKNPLSQKELHKRSLNYLVKKNQNNDPNFVIVIDQISNKEPISVFRNYSPFIDEYGIIRSHSRLALVDHLTYEMRFPILLTKDSELSELIVRSYHRKFGHTVSVETVKVKLRQDFIIIGLDSLLRRIKRSCSECIRASKKPLIQQMADIPAYRFDFPLQAFSKTGLDFAGPFYIKVGRAKQRLKSYILVFTCLQTRAIHLEVTNDQGTSSVLNALSRFIDLRGMPNEVLSDNWKTFSSPKKELQSWVRNLYEDLIIHNKGSNIIWHFIPPYGSHHGGIYEIMVKATKRALDSLFVRDDLTMDEFRTAISRVASLINSRPLTRVVNEATNEILTPNHFLIGNLGGAISTTELDNPVERWKRVHALVNKFWTQFLAEYIPLLSSRKKWQDPQNDIQVGEVVLQLDPNTPRGQWKLAVVEEIHQSENDGKVRRCKIRTSTGSYERPITKLISLEFRTFEK